MNFASIYVLNPFPFPSPWGPNKKKSTEVLLKRRERERMQEMLYAIPYTGFLPLVKLIALSFL